MIKEKINQIKAYFKTLPSNQQIIDDLDYYTFLATLIPVPGYQQAALLINKLVANHDLNLKITELRESIYQTNTKIVTIEDDVEKIQKMAVTVSAVSDLEEKIDTIIEQAKQELPSEFIVETEDWSTQIIINQIINADYTSVSAINNSHNKLLDVEINSPRTHLQAKNHSSNFLQGTNFKDTIGTVGFDGITQTGNIQVTGNSINFGDGGSLIFGDPDEITAQCPDCKNTIVAKKSEIQRYQKCQCPYCKNIYSFHINP